MIIVFSLVAAKVPITSAAVQYDAASACRGAAATSVRTPQPAGISALGAVGAAIITGSLHQAVGESFETAAKNIKTLRGDKAA